MPEPRPITPDPVRRLPMELFLSILVFALQDDYPEYATRFRLTHVCRFWRRVILSYAPFWSRITPRRVEMVSNAIRLTDLDFERASICSDLDILIAGHEQPLSPNPLFSFGLPMRRAAVQDHEYIQHYITSVLDVEVQPRVIALRFGSISRTILSHLEGRDYTRFTRLEELTFEPGWHQSEYLRNLSGDIVMKIIEASTSLQVLKLSSLTLSDAVFQPNLRILRLKDCACGVTSRLHELLPRMTSLEELIILDRLPAYALGSFVPPCPLINIPQLRKLGLSPVFDLPDSVFLCRLDCPNLRILQLGPSADRAAHRIPDDPAPRMEKTAVSAVADQHGWVVEELPADAYHPRAATHNIRRSTRGT